MALVGRPGPARTKYVVTAAVTTLIVAAAVLLASTFGPHSTPHGQTPLVRLADISRFDADFNAACDQVRVLVLLSPT